MAAARGAVAQKLVPLLPGTVAYIEGDLFWSFIKQSETLGERENFQVIMRAMTAATIPFVRSGYDVDLDFSVPPHFPGVARKNSERGAAGLRDSATDPGGLRRPRGGPAGAHHPGIREIR